MRKKIMVGLLGMILSSCASVPRFPYHFYYYDSLSKSLIGDKMSDDLPMNACDSTIFEHQCIVMKKSDFEQLYQDYLER